MKRYGICRYLDLALDLFSLAIGWRETFPSKAAIQPGDIVTEIKMTVGQNNKNDGGGGGLRGRADSNGQKVFNGGPGGGGGNGRRLPPPKLVSTSPPPNAADGDGMLLG